MGSQILVVDDSVVVRALHTYILRSHGFSTLEADSGFAALELLHQQPCGLAVVDMNMPRMDGLTLIRQIRQIPAFQSLPVIMVSTQQEARAIQKSLDAGANGYLIKPTDPAELVAKVRRLLEGSG